VDNTTPAPDAGDIANTQENWESRYLGLQKVVAKRDADMNTRQAELDALRAEHEAAQTELNDFRQKTVDASEEEQARAQYETLRTRFEPENPKPIGNNQARPAHGWPDASGKGYADRDRLGTDMGFPT
jgi:hypothetical protein